MLTFKLRLVSFFEPFFFNFGSKV